MTVGWMEMPADFKYRSVFVKGKPGHGGADAFSLRHPAMERGRRAKIFSPFDALRGFGDALAGQDRALEGDIFCPRPQGLAAK